jgi:hypothetical protein
MGLPAPPDTDNHAGQPASRSINTNAKQTASTPSRNWACRPPGGLRAQRDNLINQPGFQRSTCLKPTKTRQGLTKKSAVATP